MIPSAYYGKYINADIRQLTIVPISLISRNLASFRRREIIRTLLARVIARPRSPAMHHPLVIRRRRSLVTRWALRAAAHLTGHNCTKRLTENELSDFSRLCHDDCGKQ